MRVPIGFKLPDSNIENWCEGRFLSRRLFSGSARFRLGFAEGIVDRLEEIAGRVARAVVGSDDDPEQLLQSASLLAQLACEFEAWQSSLRAGPGEAQPAAAAYTGRKTILLVDADPEERGRFHAMVQALGHDVLEAENATAALEACFEYPRPIHALLTAVFLPDINGHELAERASLLRSDLAVVYLSAYPQADLVMFGMVGPQAVVLEKPVTADALARGLAEAGRPECVR